MPPVLVAFFLLLGGTMAPDVVRGLDPRSDRMARPKWGKPAQVEYFTRISSPRFERKGVCTYTIFAWATRNRLTRLQVQGVEQQLDWSWQWDADVPYGMRGEGMVVEFIDPVTRKVVATHTLAETCSWVPGR